MVTRAFEAVIFDLDGVITDTARLHYLAWKRLADEIGVPFDEEVNRRLKGVSRMASLAIILERSATAWSQADRERLAERKNGYYRTALTELTPQDLLPGALQALERVRAAGLKVGLASASRNADLVLDRLEIRDRFDAIGDAAGVERSKPAPDIFLQVAASLGVAPARVIGVEDAAAGIEAIRAAGMYAVGVGDAADLSAADDVIPSIASFDPGKYLSRAPAGSIRGR